MFRYFSLLIIVIAFSKFMYGINPAKKYVGNPCDYNIEYNEIQIKTDDGYFLNTWVCEGNNNNSDGTVILSYGDAGNMSYFLKLINILTRSNYRVICYDYRGFGESTSFNIDKDKLFYSEFITDTNSIIAYALNEFSGGKIGLYSLSMGTMVSVKSNLINKLDFMICDSPVISDELIIERIKSLKGKTLVAASYIVTEKDWMEISIPMLIFSSTADQFTTLEDGLRIKELKPNRQLIEYNCAHASLFYCFDQNYIKIQINNLSKKI